MIADGTICAGAFMVLSFPIIINDTLNDLNKSESFFSLYSSHNIFTYVSILGFSTFFWKDSINGQSIAKRVFKLQIVDKKTGEAASPLQCFVRNIFGLIWPVEALMIMKNSSRRLGDLVAGTEVVNYDSNTFVHKTNYLKVCTAFLLSYLMILLLTFFVVKHFDCPVHSRRSCEVSPVRTG
jgi:uncharacterized RDD family membrane protein YckC